VESHLTGRVVRHAYGGCCRAELRTSSAYSARSERIGKHFATDRHLSRGGTVDTAVPPRLACTNSGIALTTCRLLREMDVGGPERAALNILNNEKVFTVF
jgi:hypothetical protein